MSRRMRGAGWALSPRLRRRELQREQAGPAFFRLFAGEVCHTDAAEELKDVSDLVLGRSCFILLAWAVPRLSRPALARSLRERPPEALLTSCSNSLYFFVSVPRGRGSACGAALPPGAAPAPGAPARGAEPRPVLQRHVAPLLVLLFFCSSVITSVMFSVSLRCVRGRGRVAAATQARWQWLMRVNN